nr:cobalamin B12-binding domain-containing protein [Novosphingobium piscinae]
MAMAPGDQHFFGASMVERFLRAAGWSVHAAFESTPAQVGRAAHTQWFAVAALTMGSDKSIAALRDMITLIRAQSQNPDIGILVGGAPFTANPALADEVGADATAINAPAAVLMAQKLFDAAASRPGAAALG